MAAAPAETEELQVLNIPKLLQMSGGAAAEKYVLKFISSFEAKSLNETIRELQIGWLNLDKQKLEFYSHKAKGASL